jgi:hypothetical protein
MGDGRGKREEGWRTVEKGEGRRMLKSGNAEVPKGTGLELLSSIFYLPSRMFRAAFGDRA